VAKLPRVVIKKERDSPEKSAEPDLGPFVGHTAGIKTVAVSTDGRLALTGGGGIDPNNQTSDCAVRLWDVATGRQLRQLRGHTTFVNCVAFSPDGRLALSGSGDIYNRDNTVRLWDVDSGKELRRFQGHVDAVRSVAFSPDGSQALTASGSALTAPGGKFTPGTDNTVRLWDVQTGKEVRCFRGHTAMVYRAVFAPSGSQVLSCSEDGTVRLWNAATGKEIRRLRGHKGRVVSVAFSPDGRQALTGSSGIDEQTFTYFDCTLMLWDVDSGRELRRCEGHTKGVTSVVFAPDGRRALSSSYDHTVRLWDLKTGQELRRFDGHTSWVNAVVFLPDGRRALSASSDKTIRVWELPE
jgi:WD40 repeat protein